MILQFFWVFVFKRFFQKLNFYGGIGKKFVTVDWTETCALIIPFALQKQTFALQLTIIF